MGTQQQTGPSKIFKGTLARIIVASLLVVLAWPVIYMGILGTYALLWVGAAVAPGLMLMLLAPVFVVLGALGTLLSFRSALVTAAALTVFYLSWALTVYPFPGLLPGSTYHWTNVVIATISGLNLVWMVWTRCKRAVTYR